STNLFLSYIPNRYYYDKKIFYILFFFDSIMICLGIYLSGNASTDFYLIYFLIIGLASMSTSLKYLMINTTVFTLVYGWILFEKGLLTGDMGTSYALRLPFMFIIALFFGSIVDALIKDKSKSLKASEEKYRSIVESTNDTVYMVDKDSRFLSANSKFLSEHRLTEEKIIGKNFFDFHSIEETKEFSNRIDKVFETSQATHYEAFDKNQEKWVMRTLSPIIEPDTGKVKAVSVISMNITKRVKAENELKKTLNKLKETQNQLIQNEKVAALGRLASGLAHQIRNPLEIIIMGVEFIANTLSNKDKNSEKAIEKIKQAADRTNNIITNFLRFSRKSELVFKPINVNMLIDETLNLVEHKINLNRIKIKRKYAEESMKVEADKGMLQQVFVNLLSNAIDAMPNGGKIRINVNNKKAKHIAERTGYRDSDYFKIGEIMTVIEIEDTGKGITDDDLQKVFEPFFTTKDVDKGTGLGLSLAHLIIDRHRGTIGVESTVNQGTKFTIKLQPA
ncbi:MAG: ATP-binding protein, partial [Thermodesulfobacteriota bacterium]|nr:ATP-binding protein [Thermodesulfobacteriota bacterium]